MQKVSIRHFLQINYLVQLPTVRILWGWAANTGRMPGMKGRGRHPPVAHFGTLLSDSETIVQKTIQEPIPKNQLGKMFLNMCAYLMVNIYCAKLYLKIER